MKYSRGKMVGHLHAEGGTLDMGQGPMYMSRSRYVTAVLLRIHLLVGTHLVVHLIVRGPTPRAPGMIDHILPIIVARVVDRARGLALHTAGDHKSVGDAMIILLMKGTRDESTRVTLEAFPQGEGATHLITPLGQGEAQGGVILVVTPLGQREAQGGVILLATPLGQGEARGVISPWPRRSSRRSYSPMLKKSSRRSCSRS